MNAPPNTSGIDVRAASGTGGVELDLSVPAGAYDGHNNVVKFELTVDTGSVEAAYGLAFEIIACANVRREQVIADIREDRERWGLHEERTAKEIEDVIAKIPGPFVVAKARKLTDDEKAAKAGATK